MFPPPMPPPPRDINNLTMENSKQLPQFAAAPYGGGGGVTFAGEMVVPSIQPKKKSSITSLTKLDDSASTDSLDNTPASPTTQGSGVAMVATTTVCAAPPPPIIAPTPVISIAPQMDDTELENTAKRILIEFQNSMRENDLQDNMRQIGSNNHKGVITKLIHYACSSVARFVVERELLATLFSHLLAEDMQDEDTCQLRAPLVQLSDVIDGFRCFFEDVLDMSLIEDNPRLWECFADLIVHCFVQNTFTYASLSRLVPTSLINSKEVFVMVIALLKRLNAEKEHVTICCHGHFDLLQRLFVETKDTKQIDAFLKMLEDANCIEVDPSFYVYNCFKNGVQQDEMLFWLQKTIPENLSCSEIITQKVAATTILYSAVATNLFTDDDTHKEPRILFKRLLDLFQQQLVKPIMKYTQNDTPKQKLNNELQCLLEAQRFCYITSFQTGVLCNFFQVFYELEIVTEDTFYLWRNYDSSVWGRESALKEVQSFLSFLEKGDDEGADDELLETQTTQRPDDMTA
jgi:hypothetical protein